MHLAFPWVSASTWAAMFSEWGHVCLFTSPSTLPRSPGHSTVSSRRPELRRRDFLFKQLQSGRLTHLYWNFCSKSFMRCRGLSLSTLPLLTAMNGDFTGMLMFLRSGSLEDKGPVEAMLRTLCTFAMLFPDAHYEILVVRGVLFPSCMASQRWRWSGWRSCHSKSFKVGDWKS